MRALTVLPIGDSRSVLTLTLASLRRADEARRDGAAGTRVEKVREVMQRESERGGAL